MMTIRKEFSLSNILTFASLMLAIVGGWTTLNGTITSVEAKVADHDRRISDIEADGKAGRADTTHMLQDIAEIKTDLRYMRQALEKQR